MINMKELFEIFYYKAIKWNIELIEVCFVWRF